MRDDLNIAFGVRMQALIAMGRGDLDRAELLMTEALELARATRDASAITGAVGDLCNLLLERRDFSRALEIAEEVVARADALGFTGWRAVTRLRELHNSAWGSPTTPAPRSPPPWISQNERATRSA